MEIKDVMEKLESGSQFRKWQKTNAGFFLAHAFVMLDETNKDVWQIGFFNPAKNTMTTFFIENDKVKIIPDQEILKSDIGIDQLKYEEITLSVNAAINLATALLRTEYANPKIIKLFFIIQQLHSTPVYNITFFTQAFKTINVKINAVDGTILHHSQSSVADFS